MIYAFGAYRLDTDLVELHGPLGAVALEPKCFALLRHLVANRARSVSKDEIFEVIWPGVFVSDAALSTAIKQVRAAVGDSGAAQVVVKTVRGHGYRFVAEVETIEPAIPARAAPPEAPPPPRPLAGGKPTIAVRPFELLGADPSQQAIAEAIPAELIASLSRLHWLNIIARASSFQFGARPVDSQDMGSRLGAHYLVSGLVEWMDRKISISAELSDARTGQLVWTERLVGARDEIYDLRAQLARGLAIALESRLPSHETEKLRHHPSESIDAWGYYHLGIRHMFRYNRADNQIAAGHFQRALSLDPHFARAHAGLSYTEFQTAFQHFEGESAAHTRQALHHAANGLRHDEHDPFCNLIYGRAKWLEGNPEDGLIWVKRAVELNPNSAFGYYNSATLQTVLCAGRDADENVARALFLSPMDPHLQSMFGTRALAAFVTDDLAAAIRYSDRAVAAPNPHLYVFMIAAAVYNRAGHADKARACVDRIRALNAPFGKTDFLTHFNLRDPDRLAALSEAFDSLDI